MEVEETQEEVQSSEGSNEQEGEQTSQWPAEEKQENKPEVSKQGDKSSFIHGLSVGLGLGCVSTFIIIWIVVFFTPRMPSTLTYESMLSVFIYPMLYLLTVGLIALTAGIVREYYVRK